MKHMMHTAMDTEMEPPKKGFYFSIEAPEKEGAVELCIEADLGGEEKEELPLMVPTLTKAEIDHLLSGAYPTEAIVNKAVKFALDRKQAGKSQFPSPEEGGYKIPE